jgi:hypothetical protein
MPLISPGLLNGFEEKDGVVVLWSNINPPYMAIHTTLRPRLHSGARAGERGRSADHAMWGL